MQRQLSLRFAVGKPRFVRSGYAWEREYCTHLAQPNFEELWRSALVRGGLLFPVQPPSVKLALSAAATFTG